MTADLVIAHGLVVNAHGRQQAHVVVEGDRITDVLDGRQQVPQAGRTIDATGKVVVPGGVDGHCHIAQTTGPYRTLDDYALTSTAALWGGTTTVMDFGIPRDASESPLDAALAKLELAKVSRCDVALHASVVTWDETVPEQLERLAALGIRSVKLYTTNRGSTMADDDTILKVMRQMVRLDGLTYVHAEHDAMVVECTQAHADAGQIGIEHLHATRPELAEEASVREVLAMAEYTGAPLYFVHQSTPRAVDLVTEARMRGLDVHSETCPHYVLLDDTSYGGGAPEWFACCPPLRSPETVVALRERLATGGVHAVSSDHSCYDLSQKRRHSGDIRQMPHGLPGVETRMPATLTTLLEHHRGAGDARRHAVGDDLPPGVLEHFVEVFAAGPARINALPGKGVVAVGHDADLVVFDPTEWRTVVGAGLHMGTDFSPFEGLRLQGWPQVVVSSGRVVLDDQGFHDPGPVGRFIARAGYRESSSSAVTLEHIEAMTGGH